MPQLNPAIIGFLAVVANITVQATKNILPPSIRRWLSIILMAFMALVGLGIAAWAGRDLLVGTFEGFFAGASAVGLYKAAGQLPVLGAAFGRDGWLSRPESREMRDDDD